MATKKNTRNSNRRPAGYSDPLGGEQAVMNRIDGLFVMEQDTWSELDAFVANRHDAILKEYELEEGDLDGGLAIAAWIASLVKDAERSQQPQVDAAIRYLDHSALA